MRYIDLGIIKKPKKRFKYKPLFLFAIVLLAAVGFIIVLKNLLKPFSVLSQITSDSSLKSNDGRTNVLILGLDKRAPEYMQTGTLTDTVIIGSIGKTSEDVKIISLPRDLWVKISDGQFSKINEVYAYGGIDVTKNVIEAILGIPIHYYIVVGFDGFKDFVDTLGGVSVNVETSFNDYNYPIEGKEQDTCDIDLSELSEEEIRNTNFPCRYEQIYFGKGEQTFDGETALKYARSRHGTNGEMGDFSRAIRQQNLIIAIKNKILSTETFANPIRIKELYDLYKKNVVTNIGLGEVDELYNLSNNLDLNNINMIVLNNSEDEKTGGLLYTPQNSSLYGGKYVLIPKSGDFSQIRAFIQKFLFSSN